MMNELEVKSSILSKYRYILKRTIDENLPMVAFVGINPSIADDDKDDPTINKCISYCKKLNYGGFYMVNLFAYRSTDQGQLFLQDDPIGAENDKYLEDVFGKVDKVICCWGDNGRLKGRNIEVLKKIKNPYCLSINVSGEPSHPLFLKSDLEPILYNAGTISINSSKGKLKKKFIEQLKEIGSDFNITVNKCNLIPTNWKSHCIAFSYEDGGILYGIKRNKPDKNRSKLVEIEQAFEEKFLTSEWWPMYRPFYSKINTEMNFWIDIKEGKSKERAKLFVETIISKFDSSEY